MRMMNKTELKVKIEKAMEYQKAKRDRFANSKLSIDGLACRGADAKVNTLHAVLEALNGRAIYLDMLAGQ